MPKVNVPAPRVGKGFAIVQRRPDSIKSLCRELGPVVYFIRTNDGLIKIGHTGNLFKRKQNFQVDWTALLAVYPGSREDEQALHERFTSHRARAQEYYHAAPEILDHINGIRASLGVAAVKP